MASQKKDPNDNNIKKGGSSRRSVAPISVVADSCSFEFINDNVIGKEAAFKGPFGTKKAIYCDYTASGKALQCIENYISDHVYPFYANTHTTTNVAGLQTTRFREEAREIILECVHGTDEDVVIFCGSGVTGAIHKLIHVMNVAENAAKTTVIVGPYEHHSNILPWKEVGCHVERVKDGQDGKVDIELLEKKLQEHSKNGKLLIVAMSAASNVTGILSDTEQVAKLTHKYGGISLWDYATGAPYLKIDMNTSTESYKDAVFISPHKFVGGVGTPGVLVAKRKLFVNPIPSQSGGGTVNWVTKQAHEYLAKLEEREEGGTPAIVESIRAGLTFQIKNAIGEHNIEEREHALAEMAFKKWRANPNIAILGSHHAKRLPIFSFLITHEGTGKYLHHNFVSILLNDLYGIQVRGGCACAGPYAQDLLCMTEAMARSFTQFLSEQQSDKEATEKLGILKPGFTRLNLPYFFDDDTVNYILEALDQVASYGWRLLPLYSYDAHTGEWFHREQGLTKIRSLRQIQYGGDRITVPPCQTLCKERQISLAEMMADAATVMDSAKEACEGLKFNDDPNVLVKIPSEMDTSVVWFLQPKQAQMFVQTPGLKAFPYAKSTVPFTNRRNSQIRTKNRLQKVLVKAKSEGKLKTELHFISNSTEWLSEEDEYTAPQTSEKKKKKKKDSKTCAIL